MGNALVSYEQPGLDGDDGFIQHGGDACGIVCMAYELWKLGKARNMSLTLGANRIDGLKLNPQYVDDLFSAMTRVEERAHEHAGVQSHE